jgi:hypothetical protein
MPQPCTTTSPPPRWASARNRVIYGVCRSARGSLRDVMRQTRHELREAHLPVDPWLDAAVVGRSGNHASDFLVRFAQLLQVAGRTPQQVRERLVLIAHRIADALHHKTTPAHALQGAAGTVNPQSERS